MHLTRTGKGCTAVYAAMDTGSPLRENLETCGKAIGQKNASNNENSLMKILRSPNDPVMLLNPKEIDPSRSVQTGGFFASPLWMSPYGDGSKATLGEFNIAMEIAILNS